MSKRKVKKWETLSVGEKLEVLIEFVEELKSLLEDLQTDLPPYKIRPLE